MLTTIFFKDSTVYTGSKTNGCDDIGKQFRVAMSMYPDSF